MFHADFSLTLEMTMADYIGILSENVCGKYMSYLKVKKELFLHLESAKSLYLLGDGRLWNEFSRNYFDFLSHSFESLQDMECHLAGLFEARKIS